MSLTILSLVTFKILGGTPYGKMLKGKVRLISLTTDMRMIDLSQ